MSTITNAEFRETLLDWLGDKRVVFRDNWQTRDSAGGFSAHGHLHHWTAMRTTGPAVSEYLQERLLAAGRPGLGGPLCHLSTRRSGILVVIAGPYANANHAGAGDSRVWANVLRGEYSGYPSALSYYESVDGNEKLYGYEHQYHPDDGEFPEVQLETGILATAALSEAHGWKPWEAAGSTLDHFEWTSRKWDREVQDLARRTRRGVRLVMEDPDSFKENDMAFTDKDRKEQAEQTALLKVLVEQNRKLLRRHSKDGFIRKNFRRLRGE